MDYCTYLDDEGNRCLEIFSFHCSLDQFADVQSLVLDGYAMMGLPPGIEQLVDLKSYTSRCRTDILKLPTASLSDLPQLSQLTHLELCYGTVKLPTRMASCTSLTHLILDDYHYPLPDDIHVIFPQLTHFGIRHCDEDVRLPNRISLMTSLTSLELEAYFYPLPCDFHIIYPQLTHLDILECGDVRLPDSIIGMTSLTSLKLGDYPHAVPGLHTLLPMLSDKFKTLHLSECTNITIPSKVWNLLSLESLKLGNMNLDSIPDIVFKMIELTDLNVSDNNIRIIPPDISHLNKLTTLSINRSNITKLPLEIADMDELKYIFVGDNKNMVKPPIEICKKGIRAIKEYLRNASDTELTCTVQIIGETESGKTSLCRTLIDGQPRLASADDRTKVLNTHVWDPESDISIHMNDFGGHGSYKLTTRFFLALRTLLLLVFDILKRNHDNFFDHFIGEWLDSFQCYLPTARIVLVGTHCEGMGHNVKADLEKTIREKVDTKSKRIKKAITSRLRNLVKLIENCKMCGDEATLTKYEMEVKSLEHTRDNMGIDNIDIFWISSKTMEGISELKAFLIKECRGMGLVEPKQWAAFYKNLTASETENNKFKLCLPMPYVRDKFNEHKQLMNTQTPENVSTGQQNESLNIILEFFHNVGKLLLFNIHSSDGIVLHNVNMLIRVMRECFPHDIQSILSYTDDRFSEIPKQRFEVMRKRFLSSGLMGLQLFRALIDNLDFSDDEFNILVKLFKSFHLCFDVSSNNTSHLLFPWFLSDARPEKLDSKWSRSYVDGIELGFDMQFSLNVPRNFFEHAQVILHQRTGVWNGDCLDWKSGAYAVKNECRLLLQRTTETNSVQLRVRGSSLVDCLNLMNGIRTALEEKVHDGWPGATYDIVIICPHCIFLERPTPHVFMANEGYTKDDTHLRCEKDDVGVPIGLIYPVNKDATEKIRCADEFLEKLKKDRGLERKTVTEGAYGGDEASSSTDLDTFQATSGARPKERRQGHLYKEQSTVLSARFHRSLSEKLPSIGIMRWFNDNQGTAFRVGTHYVITCNHVIVPVGGTLIPEVCFNMDQPNNVFSSPTEYKKYTFSAHPVTWSNAGLDAAVLELDLPHGRRMHAVPPISQFATLDPVVHTKVHIVGHPDRGVKLVDHSCDIKPFDQHWYNNLVTWSRRQFGFNDFAGVHDDTRALYQASKDMKEGSSGGPGFVSVSEEAHLVLIHARGFPAVNRHTCRDRTRTVEQGVKMNDILNKIKSDNRDLYDNILYGCVDIEME